MKVLVKNLKGEVSEYEADGGDKVDTFSLISPLFQILSIKEQIKNGKGIDVATQKLVYKGKPTADDASLTDLGFKEGEFMVLMITKVKGNIILNFAAQAHRRSQT